MQEGAVASGVRRIEALTASTARRHLAAQEETLRQSGELLRVTPAEVPLKLATLLEERKKLERELSEARKKIALAGDEARPATAGESIETKSGVAIFARTVHGVQPKDLRGLADDAKRRLQSGVVAIVGVMDDGKAGLVVGVTDDLTDRYNAVDLVKTGAAALGGQGGGGRPDLAQAGGPHGTEAEAALRAIADKL